MTFYSHPSMVRFRLRNVTVFVVLVTASITFNNSTQAGDWPQWLGPTRNGVTTEVIEPWSESPPLQWSHPVGNGFSVPVVAAGIVYVHAAVKGEQAEQVTAFDLKSGDEKWTQKYARATFGSALGVGPRATPSVVDGHLVTFGITGELVCFNAKTGEKLWQINPYADNNIPLPGFAVCSSPLVIKDRIYIPIGGAEMAIAAYDLNTGKLVWTALDEPASSASPISWSRQENGESVLDIVVQTTLRIVGLDPDNGNVRWEHPLVFQPSGVSPTPLVTQDRLICTTQDTGTLAIESQVQSGGEMPQAWWKQDLTSYFSTGTLGQNDQMFLVTNVLMPLPRTDVRCVNSKTGEELWHQKGLGYFHVGLIATANHRLLMLDDAGTLVLAESTPTGFQELSNAKVCNGTFVNPVLSEGLLIVRDDKEIRCLKLSDSYQK